MIDKLLAESLLVVVNDPDVKRALDGYAQARITDLHRQIETANDMTAVGRAQGAIWEMRKLLKLREEVLSHGKK